MALTTAEESSRLFKALMGVSETKTIRDFFEEPVRTAPAVLPAQIWSYGNWIPTGSVSDLAGAGALAAIQAMQTQGQIYTVNVDQDTVVPLVKRWVKLQFSAIDAGTNNAFKLLDGSSPIQNIIPFNFGDGVSYNYALYASDGVTPIAFGIGDWVFDPNSGVITFYSPQNITGGGGISAANPPYFSFYQYIGGTGIPPNTVGYDGAVLPITGYAAGLNGGAGTTTWSGSALDTDIAMVTDSVQTDFLALHGWAGTDTSEGVAVAYQKLIPLIYSSSKDPVATGSGLDASEVVTLMSHIGITSNLSNITGLVVDFASQGTPVGSLVQVRYVQAAGTLELSFDGGSSWGPPVSGINTLGTGQAIKIKNSSEFLILRKIPGALPSSGTVIDTLTINNTTTRVALLAWNTDANDFVPYTNVDSTSLFDFGFPIVLKLGLIPPSLKLGQTSSGGFSDVITPEYYSIHLTSVIIAAQDLATPANSTFNASGADYMVTNTTGGYLDDILAIIYAANPTFSGEILLRQGRYLLNSDITFGGTAGVKLQGETPETAIIDANGSPRNINIPSGVAENDIFIYDLIFAGTFNINLISLGSVPVALYFRDILGPDVTISVPALCGMTITECGSLNAVTVTGAAAIIRSLESSTINTVNLNGTGTTVHGCQVNNLVGDPTLGVSNSISASQIITLTSLNENNQYIGNSVVNYGIAVTDKFKMLPQKFEIVDDDGFTRRWTGFAGPVIWNDTAKQFELSYDGSIFSLNGSGQLIISSVPFDPTGVTRADSSSVTATTIRDAIIDIYEHKADLDGFGKLNINQLPSSITGGGLVYKGMWDFVASAGAYPTAIQLAANTGEIGSGTTLTPGWFVVVAANTTTSGSPATFVTASDAQVYTAGDWAIYNGSGWERVDNSFADPSYTILPTTPPDGQAWATSGLLSLGGTTIADAADRINEALLRLAPPRPINLNQMTLAFKSISAYTAAESGSGTIHSAVVNVTQPAVTTPAGTDSISTLFYYNAGDTLTALIDSVSAGSIVLTGSGNAGVNDALSIVENNDPWAGVSGKQGLWLGLRAEIDPIAPLALGAHNFVISDVGTSGATPTFTFYVDDPATAMWIEIPTTSGDTTSGDTTTSGDGVSITTLPPMDAYLSGVPSIAPSSSFIISAFTAIGVVGQHYNSTQVARITCDVAGVPSVACPAASIPVAPSPGTYTDASVDSQTIAMPASAYNEDITFTLTPYNSKGIAGAALTLDSRYRIDTTTESERLYSGVAPEVPTSEITYPDYTTLVVFDSTQSLVGSYAGELQKINGYYQWPANVSYASYIGSNGAGPDYTGATGVTISPFAGSWRWVTFKLVGALDNNSAFTLSFTNPVGFTADANKITQDMLVYIKVVGASGTGWLNANAAYPGAGTPATDGEAAMVAGDSDAADKRVTFGTSVRIGDLYIRVAVDSTSGIQFTGVTINSLA